MSFFDELKRRNVVRVGIAYAVGAWVLLQIFDVVGESLELPEWGGRLILALMAVAIAYLLFDKFYLSQHLESIGPEAAQQAVSQPAASTASPSRCCRSTTAAASTRTNSSSKASMTTC